MKTAIQISLSDIGGDQKWYVYDSDGKSFDRKSPVDDDVKKFSSYNSGINGSGFIFDAKSSGGGLFVYTSGEKINRAEYKIITEAAPLLKGNVYAADYIGSKPEWIKDGISYDELSACFKGGNTWPKLIQAKTGSFVKKRKLISVIVDKLLEAAKGNSCAGIGLVDLQYGNLDALQKVLFMVLKKCLPACIANKFSFNTNANLSVGGMDIFCTVLRPEEYQPAGKYTFIDISANTVNGEAIDGYEYKNCYAEYITGTTVQLLKEKMSKVSGVNGLNNAVKLELLKSECIREMGEPDYSPASLKKLIGRYNLCDDRNIGNDILTAFAKIAYNIFFSEKFYGADEEIADFFKKFLKPMPSIGFTALQNAPNKFVVPADIKALFNQAYANNEGEQRYFKFLIESVSPDMLYPEAKKIVEDFLYGDIDNYGRHIGNLFKNYFNEHDSGVLLGFLSLYVEKNSKNCYLLTECLRSKCNTLENKAKVLKNASDAVCSWLINGDFIKVQDFGGLDDIIRFKEELSGLDVEKKDGLLCKIFDSFLRERIFIFPYNLVGKLKRADIENFAMEIKYDLEKIEKFYDGYNKARESDEERNDFIAGLSEYRESYYENFPDCKFDKWWRIYKRDRKKSFKKKENEAYSGKGNVIFAEMIVSVLVFVIIFVIMDIGIYQNIIWRYIPNHLLGENRYLIEGIFAGVLLVVNVIKIIYDIARYNEKAKSSFSAGVRVFAKTFVIDIAVLALAALVFCLIFVIA